MPRSPRLARAPRPLSPRHMPQELWIPNGVYRRLGMKVGIPTVAGEACDMLQQVSKIYVYNLSRACIAIAHGAKRSVIDVENMKIALNTMNLKLVGDAPLKLEKCPRIKKKRIAGKLNEVLQPSRAECVETAPGTYKKLFKGQLSKMAPTLGLKISTEALNMSQLVHEDLLMRVLQNAAHVLLSCGGKKKTVKLQHVLAASKIMNHPSMYGLEELVDPRMRILRK